MVFQGQQKPKQTIAKSCSNLIPNIEHGNQRQKLEACNTKIYIWIIFYNIWNHEYEMNQIRLWCKIIS